MKYISVDIEADGQIPGDYSMVSLGAVLAEKDCQNGFYVKIRPISDKWVPEALAVSGFTREQTLTAEDFVPAEVAMRDFKAWLDGLRDKPNDRLMFVSDNNGFDWQYVNWYFHHFIGENPFGHSSTNMGSLYKGFQQDMFANFKHLRTTKHTHNALEDARGNAEAFLKIVTRFGRKG